MKIGTHLERILAYGSAHMKSCETRCHITHSRPSYIPQSAMSPASEIFTVQRARAAMLSLHRLKYPVGPEPPSEYLDMPEEQVHAKIGQYLNLPNFKSDIASMQSLASAFQIQDASKLTKSNAILAIENAVKRVWEARDPPTRVDIIGTGRMAVPSNEMDVDYLSSSMGMDQVNLEVNSLLANPQITPDEFERRATALVNTPGFDRRYMPMLENALLNCKARHPFQEGNRVMLVAKRFLEVENIVSASEALERATGQRDAAFKVYRKMAERVGFSLPNTGNLMDTLDDAVKHCDRIVADTCAPDVIALNAENQKMLDEFADLGLLDD